MLITSKSNPKIKDLRRLFNRRRRQRTGLFFTEGLQLLELAVQAHADITTLIVAPELLDDERAAKLASLQKQANLPSLEVTAEVLNTISPQDGHQGVAAVVRQRWHDLDDLHLSPESCWLALDEIKHPGSLGTILRTSDAAGAAGLILLGDCSDPYDPTAVRASLGAIFSQCVVKATFEDFAAWTKRQPCFVVGTSPAAPLDYQAVAYQSPTILFLGSDRRGLSPHQQAVCDTMVSIPMLGRCDSHHVAVAAAIILYEILRQRRPQQKPPRKRPPA